VDAIRPLHGQLLHGNLGTSYLTQNSVAHELLSRAPSTLILTLAAMVVAIVIGVPLGILAGARPNSPIDRIARAISFLGVAVPYFFLALLLVLLLSVQLHLLPAIDNGSLSGCCSPPCRSAGVRGDPDPADPRGIIDEYRSEYIKSARARGCTESRVLLRHAVRNSSIPAITTIGLQFGNILTGAAVTEVIFGRPGLGSFLATAITNKNIPVVQGAIVVIGIGYVLINLIVDLIVGAVDPRTRASAGLA